MPRSAIPLSALILCAALAAAQDGQPATPTAPEQAGPPAPAAPGQQLKDEITPEVDAAIERGLRWLAKQQQPDGSFGAGSGTYDRHVGITALCGLAFLADGSLPGTGRYSPQVEKCLRFVLDCSQEDGLLIGPQVDHGPMYGHGFATLFLAEVYGQTQDEEVKEKLRRAVRLMVVAQNDEGGWRYQAQPLDADTSVTICSIMGLRAARNAGINVPKQTIDRAVDYVVKCQQGDGGFAYMLQSAGSAPPRSAAGLATLYYAGVYQGKAVDKAVSYMLRHLPGRGSNDGHYYYLHYYAMQAMFQAGGDAWAQWWPAASRELLGKQAASGAWTQGDSVGPEYQTAMALIALQVPKRLLPILQR